MLTGTTIHALRIANGALAAALSADQKDLAARLPKRLQVFGWGANDTTKGAYLVDGTPEAFQATQLSMGLDKVAIDFEHNTVPGTEAYKASAEPRPVAGYGRAVLVPLEGLYLDEIVWTPAGIAHALNYMDLSPAPVCDANRRVVALHSVALTRAGATKGLEFLAADLNPPTPTEKSPMDEDMKKMLADLSAGLAALREEVATLKKEMAGMTAEPLSASISTLAGQITGLEARVKQGERQALIDRATADGKVIPLSADEVAKCEPAFLSAMIEKLPAGQVPLDKRTAAPVATAPHALDASLEAVAKASGFTVEQLRANSLNPKGN